MPPRSAPRPQIKKGRRCVPRQLEADCTIISNVRRLFCQTSVVQCAVKDFLLETAGIAALFQNSWKIRRLHHRFRVRLTLILVKP